MKGNKEKVAQYLHAKNERQLKEQEGRLNQYCEVNNYDIYDKYVDFGFSGFDINRPSYNKMLADIKNNKFTKIIATDFNRISRHVTDIILLQNLYLEKYNCKLELTNVSNEDVTYLLNHFKVNRALRRIFTLLEKREPLSEETDGIKKEQVATYIRTTQSKKQTAELQLRKIINWCAEHNYEVCYTYEDLHCGTGNIFKRLNGKWLISDMRKKKFNKIVIANLDVLSTKEEYRNLFFKELEKENCHLEVCE